MLKHVIAASGAILLSSAAQAETVVVTADHMVDVVAGKTIDYPAVFITDGRITSVADARTVKWGSDVKHIDLSGADDPARADRHARAPDLAR